MINRIKDTLIKGGMPCYDPGVKIGTVKESYAVAYDRGDMPQAGTKGKLGQKIFEVVVLVPLSQQRALADLERKVIGLLSEIKNLKFTGESQTSSIEQEFAGVSKSLLFRQPVRL